MASRINRGVRWVRHIAWALALALVADDPIAAEIRDPGILIQVDLSLFLLTASDGADQEGPSLPVAIGSPERPTPVGTFRLRVLVLNPTWTPAASARHEGAEPIGPSGHGPMGIAKIPFASGGRVALHGGGTPLLLGKEISAGCIRVRDTDLIRLIGWLSARGALDLERAAETESGEVLLRFLRPTRLRVH